MVSLWPVATVLPGIHTSIRRSDGSVKFSQTDSGMVNLVQTSQSPGLLEIVYNQLNRVSSSKVYVRRRPLHVERLGGLVSSVWFSQITLWVPLGSYRIILVEEISNKSVHVVVRTTFVQTI